jgi:type IV secretory pathway TrbD component
MREWERPSFEMNTRPIKVERDIRREDLLTPAYERTIALVAGCLLCGVMLSVLYIYFPLLLITFAGFDLGPWLLGSVAVGAVASAIGLYVWEIANRRDFFNEL